MFEIINVTDNYNDTKLHSHASKPNNVQHM